VRGVESVCVDACAGEVTVVRRCGRASDATLLNALSGIGYRAQVLPLERTTLRMRGIDDDRGCRRVRQALRRVRGVRAVEVDGTRRAHVTFDRRQVNRRELVRAAREAGFEAS
jgi:copper chaperone CopZ